MAAKYVTKKKHDAAVADLTARAEKAEGALSEMQRTAQYWQNRASELQSKQDNHTHEKGCAMGLDRARANVLETALRRAHVELSGVKPQEQTAVALQRVLGSVQGGIAVALEQNGNMQGGFIDLYPQETNTERTIDIVTDALRRNQRGY